MLERTVSPLHYAAYNIFVGAYPNDELTVRAVTETARHHPRIQVAMLPIPVRLRRAIAGTGSTGGCRNTKSGPVKNTESSSRTTRRT
jgi:hypothetical protein